jgi:hypothetical protein
MLRSLNELERYKVTATDGPIGTAVDFFLDDERWAVRYLVVETAGFLDGRRVLVSPISFRSAEWASRQFHVALTKDKVKHSPGVDVDKPVSRQHEQDYARYYGYPSYWGYTGGLWGMGPSPQLLAPGSWDEARAVDAHVAFGDVHLRSAQEIHGYEIEGSDGVIGHVGDLIVDDETWAIRYLRIDTGNWWAGKKVLVSPQWATSVSWAERKVHMSLARQQIKDSPEWNGVAAVNRKYEAQMYDHYGRPVYWLGGDHPEEALVEAPKEIPKETPPSARVSNR